MLLPENLFYNTTAPGIILVVNRPSGTRAKSCSSTPASLFAKGRPKNYLTGRAHRPDRRRSTTTGRPRRACRAVITTAEAARNDYNLSPQPLRGHQRRRGGAAAGGGGGALARGRGGTGRGGCGAARSAALVGLGRL